MTVLDEVLPDYADREVHETAIAAPVEATWHALRAITPGELPVSRALMALRSVPARLARRGALAGRADAPLLDQFLELGFRALVDEPPRSFVAGGIGQPWRVSGGRFVVRDTCAEFAAFAEPGFVLMAFSLEVAPAGAGGSRLRTETRVRPTDRGAARSFAPYWLVVKPFSALIRRDLLRGIRRRAETADATTARAPGGGADGRGAAVGRERDDEAAAWPPAR